MGGVAPEGLPPKMGQSEDLAKERDSNQEMGQSPRTPAALAFVGLRHFCQPLKAHAWQPISHLFQAWPQPSSGVVLTRLRGQQVVGGVLVALGRCLQQLWGQDSKVP